MKDEAAQERECQNTAFTFFLLFVCLFTFFGREGGGGGGESELPFILSKTGLVMGVQNAFQKHIWYSGFSVIGK